MLFYLVVPPTPLHCREDDCQMCQTEKKTERKSLGDLNSPATMCCLDKVVMGLPLVTGLPYHLAELFGYHDESDCNCDNKQIELWGSDVPIKLPFSLGELTGKYLGSGLEECLANIGMLISALFYKLKENKTIPRDFINEFILACCPLTDLRLWLWKRTLITGSVEMAECLVSANCAENHANMDKFLEFVF